LPARFVIPAASEIPAVRIRPADRRQGWSYKFNYRFSFGDPAAVHQPPRAYRPPLAPGHAFPITQAFHGSFSHHESYSEYAVDIAMPEGTPVHAVRAGVVMVIANDFYGNGLDLEKYGQRANFICIAHDDGTMAIYAHLQLETSQVSPGARVAAGQLLGYSGNTGYSGGPHLHFVIQRNAGMRLVAVPFEFDDGQGRGVIPEAGKVLQGL
jgi:murein DD-endopeptidase MepM/ murein hydrolase activator NlpD